MWIGVVHDWIRDLIRTFTTIETPLLIRTITFHGSLPRFPHPHPLLRTRRKSHTLDSGSSGRKLITGRGSDVKNSDIVISLP